VITEPHIALLLALVLLAGAVCRQTQARCPEGSYVEGVRPSGVTRCMSVEADYDCRGANRCHGRAARWSVPMQVYCTGGAEPIVVDGRTIACQRRYGR